MLESATGSGSISRYKLAVLAAADYFVEQPASNLSRDGTSRRYSAMQRQPDTEELSLCRANRESIQWLPRAVVRTPDDWKCAVIEWHEMTSEGAAGPEEVRLFLGVSFEQYATAAPPKLASETESLQQTFDALAKRWREETKVLSSITMKSMHPAYQRIIGMGPQVLPLILRELDREPDHWFWALTAITGEDPVPPEDAGDIEKMTEAWLRLGRRRGLL